jgi:hypothetical protein
MVASQVDFGLAFIPLYTTGLRRTSGGMMLLEIITSVERFIRLTETL